MAILEIEMPETCYKCPLSYVDGRDVVCCPLEIAIDDNEGRWLKERHSKCPLKEKPKACCGDCEYYTSCHDI